MLFEPTQYRSSLYLYRNLYTHALFIGRFFIKIESIKLEKILSSVCRSVFRRFSIRSSNFFLKNSHNIGIKNIRTKLVNYYKIELKYSFYYISCSENVRCKLFLFYRWIIENDEMSLPEWRNSVRVSQNCPLKKAEIHLTSDSNSTNNFYSV